MKFTSVSRSRLLLLEAVIALSVACVFAQTQPPPQESHKPVLKRLKGGGRVKAPVVAGDKGASGGDEVVRVETSLVVCDVLVLDARGNAARGLTRDDFVVTEDGRPQEVAVFAPGDNASVPRSIVLIIDHSRSLGPFIAGSVEAAKKLVDQLGPRDRMAVVTDDVELLADFTHDKAELKKTLDALKMKVGPGQRLWSGKYGRSQQYTALVATLDGLFDEEDARRVVIFQTDGDQLPELRDSKFNPPPGVTAEQWKRTQATRGQVSLADVFAAAERARVTIYSVIPGVRLVGLAPGEKSGRVAALRSQFEDMFTSGRAADPVRDETFKYLAENAPHMQMAMAELSNLSGGWVAFLEKPSQAADIYARILSDINRRYVVGYYPTNKEQDGARRRVNIEVRGHPEYTVWGRKAYYAPGSDR